VSVAEAQTLQPQEPKTGYIKENISDRKLITDEKKHRETDSAISKLLKLFTVNALL